MEPPFATISEAFHDSMTLPWYGDSLGADKSIFRRPSCYATPLSHHLFGSKPPRDVQMELRSEIDEFVQKVLAEYAKLFLQPASEV